MDGRDSQIRDLAMHQGKQLSDLSNATKQLERKNRGGNYFMLASSAVSNTIQRAMFALFLSVSLSISFSLSL